MSELNENDANALPAEDDMIMTPKKQFAKDAGLDSAGAKRFSEELSPSIVLEADNDDFKAAGIPIKDRVRLKSHARRLATIAEDAPSAAAEPLPPFNGAAASMAPPAPAPALPTTATRAAPAIPGQLDDDDEEEEQAYEYVGDEFDDLLAQADLALKRQSLGGRSVAALNKWEKAKRFYEDVVGGNFVADDGSMIIIKCVIYFANDTTTRASTKRTRLQAISSMVDNDRSKTVNEQAQSRKKQALRDLGRQERKDISSGVSNPNCSITYKDTLHMINSLTMAETDHIIPTRYLEIIQFQMIGQVTGKRALERNTIAASSWQLIIRIRPSDGKRLRVMKFAHGFMKDKGPGIYQASFMEADELEANGVVITLVLLQRKGMIRSALDVYLGREVLAIDETIFETPADIVEKIRRAQSAAVPATIARLTGNEETSTTRSAVKSFLNQIKSLDQPGDKIPMYTTYPETILQSTRFNAKDSATYRKIGERCGYRPTQDHHFGATGGRKFCRQASRNVNDLGIDVDSHLNQSLSHSTGVAHDHYERHDEYQGRFPANLFHGAIDPEMAVFLVDSNEVTPAFKRPGFFKPDWAPQLDPLPSAEDFIREQSFRPIVDCLCPFVGCEQRFYYAGDLKIHVMSAHKGTAGKFQCQCTRQWQSAKKYRSHIAGTEGFPACPKRDIDPLYYWNPNKSKANVPPNGLAYFLCDRCPDKYFVTRKNIVCHIGERHKDGGVTYNDGMFCLPVAETESTLEDPPLPMAGHGSQDADSTAGLPAAAKGTKKHMTQGIARVAKAAGTGVVQVTKGAGKAIQKSVAQLKRKPSKKDKDQSAADARAAPRRRPSE